MFIVPHNRADAAVKCHPSFELVSERVFAGAVRGTRSDQVARRRRFGAVDASDGRHQTDTAATLPLETVRVTVRHVVADKVGTVRKCDHHLNTTAAFTASHRSKAKKQRRCQGLKDGV